ncbi:MBL fold metallo-hydrolase [Salinactinospora qingdaonensis]|uniref:MBL fold metallo-hydrolase n=1 Tax=Salinactinospora qingdaonensis TaxID=702744 RepID=A0ABP7FMD7_9ACTN
MFWKRKGKKKDGDDAGSTTATAEIDRAEAADTEETAEGTKGATTVSDDAIERVETAGALSFEGQEFETVSNTWIVPADDEGVIVVDPAHDAKAILTAVGEREIYLVACTNGYNTHIGAAIEVADRDEAPIALHPREMRSWRRVHGIERKPDWEVEGGGSVQVGELEIDILAVPGTSSGTVAYYIPRLGVVFSGDTLLDGRLGTVGEGYVDFTTQLASVGETLLSLPPDTRVLPDTGPETTVGQQAENFDSWVAGD